MRIVKSQAIGVLEAENKLLDAQKSLCAQQSQNLENLSLAGLKGDAAEGLGLRTKAQAAIVEAHLAFYDSLLEANRANMGLVRELPETSPGVLDTVVAADRLMEARGRLGSLEQEMGLAISEAEEANKSARNAMGIPAPGYNAPTALPIDTYTIRQSYETLMRVQQIAAHENQMILEKAEQYEQASQHVYQSVDTTNLYKSIGLCGQYASGKYVDVASLPSTARSTDAGIRYEQSALDVRAEANAEVLGMAVSGAMSTSLLGVSASVKPYSSVTVERGKEDKTELGIGVKAEAEAYALKEEVSGSWGAARGSATVEVLSGAVCGEIGASFDPTTGKFKAGFKAEAEGSVVELHGDAQIGDDDYNVHANVDAKLLTASAKVGLSISDEGIEAKAGAEAYLATGEVVGGFTFLGVKVDAIGEAKIGGGGATAELKTNADGMELDLGLGLLLGVGTKVKVDWSGFPAAWDNAMDNMGSWWNDKVKVDWSGIPAAWDNAMSNIGSWWNDSVDQLNRLFRHGGGGSHRF